MDRVFLDANVLFSAAYWPDGGLLRLWDLTEVQLLSSVDAVDEARRNLAEGAQQARIARLLGTVGRVTEVALFPPGAESAVPEKDRPILQAAAAAAATHLLTGDVRHFGPLFGQTLLGVKILSPAAYLRET